MAMFLYVKGTAVEQAIEAARLRKLEGPFESNKFNKNEIILKFNPTEGDRLAVVKWFCEEAQIAPFRNGTLLFYSEGH